MHLGGLLLLYDIFESWLCDLFKLICNDIIITGKSSSDTDSRTEGTLGGTQYRNAARKTGKYRNAVSKLDEIPIPNFMIGHVLLKAVSISRVCHLKHVRTRNQL